MKTFVLTEEQAMIRDLASDLAKAEIMPRSEAVDHTGHCPTEGIAALAGAGLVACTLPEALGGAELDHWSQTVVIEEIAKECASTAWVIANTVEVAECILRHGTEAQKNTVLPRLASGSLAAPAGRDTAVTAEKTGGGYVLNGTKTAVPNAGSCDWYLVPARDGDVELWFFIASDAAGLEARSGTPQLGMKGCPLGELVFNGCTAAADTVLAGNAADTLCAAQALNMAAIAAGIAQGAAAEAIKYINQRVQFGTTIAQFQNTQHVMAQLLAQIEGARALVWDAAHVKDSGEDYAPAAALAKLMASDTAATVTRKCVQFMGGYGYSREYPVERKMRDAKMTELLCGASAYQKDVVAKAVVVQ